jgi:hypothetical protein
MITLQEYKDAKSMQSTKDDTRLEFLISSVSQLVKTYCGTSFTEYFEEPKVELFNIDWNTHIVQLTESPVVAVDSVEERDGYTSSYKELGATEFYVDPLTDSVLRTSGGNSYRSWPRGPGAVRVTYTAGYEEVPSDLKLAVIDLVHYYFKDEYKERKTIGSSSIENFADSVDFPAHIKRVLDLYRE